MAEKKTVTITCSDPDFYGKRIDQFLVSVFPEHSRTSFQKLIDEGHVSLNNTVVLKPRTLLDEHDVITITFPPPEPIELVPQHVDFEVVDVQDDFLIINKPAGLVVHQTPDTVPQVTLVHGLLYAFRELAEFDEADRPGIVHRLDKNTSGLMIIARTPQAQAKISAQFKNREIKKSYLAMVHGHPAREGAIDFPIGRHPKQRHKMSHVGYGGRDALTNYKTLVYYKDAALVKAMPITGRTHQIRVHLAAIGHGILGDELYGVSSKLIKRQALHAWQLRFTYEGTEYFYCTSLPEDMRALLRSMKREH